MSMPTAFTVLLITMFLTAVVFYVFLSQHLVQAASTIVQVEPSLTSVSVGTVFNINVTVTDVSNLCGWEFNLYFLNAIINCTAVTEGAFLKSVGPTFFVADITNNHNSTHGRVLAGCTLQGPGSASGSGVLATLTFNATSNGDTNLDLQDTGLGDANSQPIPHDTFGGSVRVGPIHDLTVVNVVPLKRTVGKGSPDNFTVAVQNIGDFTETFSVTFRLNSTDIGTKELTLPSGQYTFAVFTWSTASSGYGTYVVSAYAWPVVNETNTSDNTKIDGTVTVTVVGDINGDEIVDIYDAILLSSSFNADPSKPNWNADADLNCDGIVDIYDATLLASNLNKHV